MSLTRKFLSSVGLEEAKIDSVIEAHTETVDGLKKQIEDQKRETEAQRAIVAERDKTAEELKAQIATLQKDIAAEKDKTTAVQKELDGLKAAPDYKSMYETEKKSFEQYKADVANKETLEKVRTAYRGLLKGQHVGSDQIEAIVSVTDFGKMALNAEGKFDNAEQLEEDIRNKWSGFIVKTGKKSDPVPNPPKGNETPFETMSLADKMAFANAHPTDPSVRAWLTK